MIKKLAIFVEGQTEQIFVERLIKEIAGELHVHLESRSLSHHGLICFNSIPTALKKFQVVLFNCESDGKVKSAILDVRGQLIAKNYSLIIGLRDLYPQPLVDLPRIKARLKYGLPTALPTTEIYLAVGESEAWFLQEKEHYSKIDRTLDYHAFKALFGFDPESDSAEMVDHPSELLKSIYQSVGKTYRKKRYYVQRTVDALDFAELCFSCGAKIPHFELFFQRLYGFFA